MGNLRETWGEMVLCTPLHVHCFWFRHFFPRIELYKRRLIDRQLASFRLSEFISKLKLRTFTLMIFRRWLCPILFIIRIMRLKFWKFENNPSTTYATLKFYMSCNLLNCCPIAEIKNLRTTNNNSEESAKKHGLIHDDCLSLNHLDKLIGSPFFIHLFGKIQYLRRVSLFSIRKAHEISQNGYWGGGME